MKCLTYSTRVDSNWEPHLNPKANPNVISANQAKGEKFVSVIT